MMKTFFSVCLFIFITACSKKGDNENLNNKLTGTWEYETFSGYPFNQPVLPPGNGRLLVFGKNGAFERWQKDTLLFKGKYFTVRKKDCYPGGSDVMLVTTEGYDDNLYVTIEDNRLQLRTPNCLMDGGTIFYRKIR